MMPPTNSISEMLSKETIHWRHIYEWGFRKTLNVRGTNLVPSRFLLALEPIERQALAQKAFEQGYLQQKDLYAQKVFGLLGQNPGFTQIEQYESKNIFLLATHKQWYKLLLKVSRQKGKKGDWVFLPEKVNLSITECSSDLNIIDLAYLDSYGNANEQPHAKQFFDRCVRYGIKGKKYHGDTLAVYIRNQKFDVIFNKFYHDDDHTLRIPSELNINAELPIACEQNTQG